MAVKTRPRSAQTGTMELPQGALFVQKGGAGQPLEYVTCHGVDGLTRDKGAPEFGYCIIDGVYVIRSSIRPAPTGTSFDVTTGQDAVKSIMDKLLEQDCASTFAIKYSACGKPHQINDWDVWKVFPFATVNSEDGGTPVAWNERARIERSFSVTSPHMGYTIHRPFPKTYPVDPAETTYSATAVPTNIHVPVGRGNCGGACGTYEDSCSLLIAGTNSGVGAPGATNESGILISRDSGATWEFVSFGQGDYAYTHAVILDDGTFVAVGHLDDGTAIGFAYGTITASGVTVGDTGTIADSLVGATVTAIYTDGDEVWVAIENLLYVSTDGGVTWTLAYTGAAGDIIRSIHFNGEWGYAVGVDNGGVTLVIASPNGGDSWADISPVSGAGAYGVYALGNAVWMAADNALYVSTDNGATWQTRTAPAGGILSDIEFYDENVGVVVAGGKVYMTVFGGAEGSWSLLGDVTGLSQIEFCAPDSFWVLVADGTLIKYEPKSA